MQRKTIIFIAAAFICLFFLPPETGGEQVIYDSSYNPKYRIDESGRIYDNNWKHKGRIDGDRVYDENYKLKYRIRDDRVYDRDWNLKGRIRQR